MYKDWCQYSRIIKEESIVYVYLLNVTPVEGRDSQLGEYTPSEFFSYKTWYTF